MWKCELCGNKFNEKTMAVEVKFGYVDKNEGNNQNNQYDAFYPENAWAPLCDDCAIAYIKGEK